MFGGELIKSCIGHRISEYKDLVNYNGISVFYDGNRTYSKDGWALPNCNHIFESYNMKEFIDKFPQFADFIIVRANEFFDEYVFRIKEDTK